MHTFVNLQNYNYQMRSLEFITYIIIVIIIIIITLNDGN